MVFSSLLFLFRFLPLVLLFYYAVPVTWRNFVLFAASLIKYKRNETLDVFLAKQCAWFRWLAVCVLFAYIFLFGIYGPGFDASQFIYFQF